MRAVLMQHGRLWVDQVDTPQPGAGEVLVRTLACGICGSDLHAARHNHDFVTTSREAGGAFKLTTFQPVVLGHEFSAEIVDFGSHTERRLAVGQSVCSVPMVLRQPPQAVGYSDAVPGGFGEYMVLSERMLVAVPDGTPATAAALTEPMAVGLHAVNKSAITDECALVLGCGPVGLAVITALQSRGTAHVIASDFSPTRRRAAQLQGADEVIDPATSQAFEAARRTGKALVVFECVGVPGMLDHIFLQAPANTRIVVVGVCLQQDHIRPLIAINKELSLQFVLGYTAEEFSQALAHIADGTFDIAPLITHEIGLAEVPAMFDALQDPESFAKVLVNPAR